MKKLFSIGKLKSNLERERAMEVKKRELDEAMGKIYVECGQLRLKFQKEEGERCSSSEWKREDGDSFLKMEAYERVQRVTDEYYIKCLDERTVRIPKDMIIIKDNDGDICTRPDISAMKATAKSLAETIAKAEKAAEEIERRCGHVDTIKEMFKKYVTIKYPSKRFGESAVTGTGSYNEGSMRISYTYDGVVMSYLGRQTRHNGDYDWFEDKSIYVDGLNVLNEVKQ